MTKAVRNAAVVMPDGRTIGYPIENHLYQLDREVVEKVISDLIKPRSKSPRDASNFEEFLRLNFGETLYDLYFRPYNRKIWKSDLSSIPMKWLDGKFPMPKASEIIMDNIFRADETKFVHSTFFYPHKGGSQFIVDRLSRGLNIFCSSPVRRIYRDSSNEWVVNGRNYDAVVISSNIKNILPYLEGIQLPDGMIGGVERLAAHGTTSVFCEIDANPYSWIYQPSEAHLSHRIICTGNFSSANNGDSRRLTATIEFTDYLSKDEILDNLTRIPFNPTYITHNFELYTYPIQGEDTRELILQIKKTLSSEGIFLVGRFADWEYYNMDTAMAAAIRMAPEVIESL